MLRRGVPAKELAAALGMTEIGSRHSGQWVRSAMHFSWNTCATLHFNHTAFPLLTEPSELSSRF